MIKEDNYIVKQEAFAERLKKYVGLKFYTLKEDTEYPWPLNWRLLTGSGFEVH